MGSRLAPLMLGNSHTYRTGVDVDKAENVDVDAKISTEMRPARDPFRPQQKCQHHFEADLRYLMQGIWDQNMGDYQKSDLAGDYILCSTTGMGNLHDSGNQNWPLVDLASYSS